jgi:hypothetical protein
MTSRTVRAGDGAASLLAMKLRDIERAKQQLKAFVDSLKELKEANQKPFK